MRERVRSWADRSAAKRRWHLRHSTKLPPSLLMSGTAPPDWMGPSPSNPWRSAGQAIGDHTVSGGNGGRPRDIWAEGEEPFRAQRKKEARNCCPICQHLHWPRSRFRFVNPLSPLPGPLLLALPLPSTRGPGSEALIRAPPPVARPPALASLNVGVAVDSPPMASSASPPAGAVVPRFVSGESTRSERQLRRWT